MGKSNDCKFTDCRENFMTQDGDYYLVRCPKCLEENYHANVSLGMCGFCGWLAHEHVSDDERLSLEMRLIRELNS